MKRGNATIALERIGGSANLSGPAYALVHDAYHTLPGQFCEGRPGSGMSFRFTDKQSSTESTTIYKIALGNGPCQWNLASDGTLTSPQGKKYSITIR